MLFSVGYQADERLKRTVLRCRDAVRELYFPWAGFSSGRGVPRGGAETQRRMERDLAEYAAAGLGMNLLLNGNCYGRHSQSRGFFQEVGDTVAYLVERVALGDVTTASPLIAKFLKTNFPELELRASVNMEIGTPAAAGYLLPLFDAFYLKREFNYDLERIAEMREWGAANGKKLYLLANSGCLDFCPARTFHDNLVAHQHEIAEMDNAFDFPGLCHEFLSETGNRATLLSRSNFIRPEDVPLYEGLCDGMKLATRTNRNPAAVVAAYAEGRFSGNLLELTEPAHAGHFYPEIIAGDRFPSDYAARRLRCRDRREAERYCNEVQKNATIRLEEMEEMKHADQ